MQIGKRAGGALSAWAPVREGANSVATDYIHLYLWLGFIGGSNDGHSPPSLESVLGGTLDHMIAGMEL